MTEGELNSLSEKAIVMLPHSEDVERESRAGSYEILRKLTVDGRRLTQIEEETDAMKAAS